MRVVIVSRIFLPEPSAASFKLGAIASAFAEAGHHVTVLTTRPRGGVAISDIPGVRVKRARVLRDRTGYVRGYLPYLSFDIPAFFRILFGPRADLYLVEPPPTTGAVVRVAAGIRRRPYFYDAADLWSDAAQMTTSSRVVIGLLRRVERFAFRGARFAFAVSEGLLERMRAMGIATPAAVVTFGADTRAFRFDSSTEAAASPYFIYAGTYSEFQGAGVFIDAFARILPSRPRLRLLFVGNGSDRAALERKCGSLGLDSVEFREPIPAKQLNPLLNGAIASLASIRPGEGYDYAFPSKVYSSIAAGCPIVFAGVGPTADFIRAHAADHGVGVAASYEIEAVSKALEGLADHPVSPSRRRELSAWAAENFSLDSSARIVVRKAVEVVGRP